MPKHVSPKTSILANTAQVSDIIQTTQDELASLATLLSEEGECLSYSGENRAQTTSRGALTLL